MKILEFIKNIFRNNNKKLLEANTNQDILISRKEIIKEYGFKSCLNKLVYEIAKMNVEGKTVRVPEEDDRNDMKLFIYYVISTMINQDYVADINSIKEFEQIEFLENDENYKCGIHNKKILVNMRNALTHKSGNIELDQEGNIIISNSARYGKTIKNFKVKIKENILIEFLRKSTLNHRNSDNNTIKELFSMIDDLENDKIVKSKNASYVVLLSLLFSFNKESLFDKYMNFSNTALDLSFLSVKNTGFEKTDEYVNYFEQHEIVPTSLEEELIYQKERVSLAKKGIFFNDSQNCKKCLWDSKRFAFDEENKIHIPNEIVLGHIRNALSHGYIDIDDNNDFLIYDKSRPTAPKYFEMKINNERINEIIKTDYFREGINIPEELHKNEWRSHLYRTELVKTHNSFNDFVSLYINKFPDLSVEEVIKYMYDNNKFSTYIFEHPFAIREYWKYCVPGTHKLLIEYIAELANREGNDSIAVGNPSELIDSREAAVDSFYNDFMKKGDMSYFKALLIHYTNRYSIKSIKEIESECSKEKVKKFVDQNFIISLFMHSMNDETEWAAIGNILKNKSEFDRIATSITCHDKYILDECINDKIQYQDSIISIEDVYKQGVEYRMSEKLYQYMKEHKLQKFISEMKWKIGLSGIEMIKKIASKDAFYKAYREFYDYLGKGNMLDKINAMRLLNAIPKKERENVDNDEICNR